MITKLFYCFIVSTIRILLLGFRTVDELLMNVVNKLQNKIDTMNQQGKSNRFIIIFLMSIYIGLETVRYMVSTVVDKMQMVIDRISKKHLQDSSADDTAASTVSSAAKKLS